MGSKFIIDVITIIGAFAAGIAAIFSIIMWRIYRNQELSRFMALLDHLDFIESSAKGHERHIKSKDLPLPSWPIANMDLNFYLTNINYKVRKKWSICRESTRNLKIELIQIYEKINNINFLWKLKFDNPDVKSDLKTNTYYEELYRYISNCKSEIRRILN